MVKPLVKSLVIGFGFLNGIWLAIGIDPQQTILRYIQPTLSAMHPYLKAFFIILPTLLLIGTIITFLKIYDKGGLFGAAAVLIAFVAGGIILKNYIASIVLLVIAMFIGQLSFKIR